ncbi:MAG: DUF6261 family protein [Prevotellaceae bacterium]|jgi:hypothetical protein|nr:DUF6261 family protein [Prevotellaceae bacterium]
MSLKIDGYKSLLTRITIAQNVQFHREAATGIAPFTAKVNGIATAFDTYREDTDRLDDEFNTQAKSIETGELLLLDNKRDSTTVQIISRIDYHAKFPENKGETEAARKLKFIADAYRDAPQKDYQAETSYLRNMIGDLNQHADCLSIFGLRSLVSRLERENNDFEALYLTRTGNREAKRERGTLSELAGKTNASFDIVCQIVNGLSLMSLDADMKAALDEITGFINGQIHQYTVVYRRHMGVVTGKKRSETPEAEGD